ncbi:MAG: alpha-galactosidase [Gemmiger sp.]|nr:alpha-galactosidase [Gemmiger sp.]
MAILSEKQGHLFTLHTAHATYQMQVGPLGWLLHNYDGAKIEGQDLSYLVRPQDRAYAPNPADAGGDRTLSPDTLPMEYSTFGLGDFRESCLDVRHADGSVGVDLRYKAHRIIPGKPALAGLPASYGTAGEVDTLEIDLADTAGTVLVTLSYAVFAEDDVIARSAKITNTSKTPVTLTRALSLCLDSQQPAARDVMTFYGRHMGEKQVARTPLRHGKIRVDSVRGASSPQQSPFVILCDAAATETVGECKAFSFVYSGSFLAQAELDQAEQLRLVMGIHPQNFSWQLAPGEAFQTPEVLCCFSECGFDALSNRLHRFQLAHLMRGEWRKKRCPVLVNNWEATYFDFDEAKLLKLAKEAKALGIEMLVLDDGWFGRRNDDTTSLGDWFVNREKLPEGIAGLGAALHGMGMQFGLWFEPEMISPDSDLMRPHPDWALRLPGRPLTTSRAQCVLDMSRPDVQDYLYDAIRAVVEDGQLDYIKWDMNRHIAESWSALLPPERQGELRHRYMLGLYALLERLLARFPHLLLESCASGGGRFDAGMLYYSPQIWGSDNTDAIDRLKIQYGNSFAFPIKSVGSHVSVCPNHQTGRVTPFATRAAVAMSGSFGYEMDLTTLTAEEKAEVRRQVEYFKAHHALFQLGSYHRLTNAQTDDRFTAWMSVAPDKRQAIVTVVQRYPLANGPIQSVRLRGLDPALTYCDAEGHAFTGSALMNAGLLLPPIAGEYGTVLFEFNALFELGAEN